MGRNGFSKGKGVLQRKIIAGTLSSIFGAGAFSNFAGAMMNNEITFQYFYENYQHGEMVGEVQFNLIEEISNKAGVKVDYSLISEIGKGLCDTYGDFDNESVMREVCSSFDLNEENFEKLKKEFENYFDPVVFLYFRYRCAKYSFGAKDFLLSDFNEEKKKRTLKRCFEFYFKDSILKKINEIKGEGTDNTDKVIKKTGENLEIFEDIDKKETVENIKGKDLQEKSTKSMFTKVLIFVGIVVAILIVILIVYFAVCGSRNVFANDKNKDMANSGGSGKSDNTTTVDSQSTNKQKQSEVQTNPNGTQISDKGSNSVLPTVLKVASAITGVTTTAIGGRFAAVRLLKKPNGGETKAPYAFIDSDKNKSENKNDGDNKIGPKEEPFDAKKNSDVTKNSKE